MSYDTLSDAQIFIRQYWVHEISRLSGNFGVDTQRVEYELSNEIRQNPSSLLSHVRLCGAIPERYGHDTSEEKLYSKYTDIVIHECFQNVGLDSAIIQARADVADVECVTDNYSFVADAKAFRLSRTAKNQKDFKVQAMENWKHGKPYALLVCPSYQLPANTSQIYSQAAARSVCIITYSHLAVLVQYAQQTDYSNSLALLHKLFQTVEAMNPSKRAHDYWMFFNRTMLEYDNRIRAVWQQEKKASIDAVKFAKSEALEFLAEERERIMKLSKEDAIREIIDSHNIDGRKREIEKVTEKGIMEMGF